MLFTKLRKSTKTIVWVVAAAFAITLLYGYNKMPKGTEGVNDVIAKVNGQKVSRVEFQHLLVSTAQSQEQTSGPIPGDQMTGMKASLLDQMIDQVAMLQAAKDARVKVDRKDVDKEFDRIKNQFPSKDTFAQALQENGMTERSLRDRLTEMKLLEKFQAEKRKELKVTASDLAKAYEQVKASHILVKADKGNAASEAAAKAKVDKVYAEVKAGGDFAALAKKYSDDPGSKESGGDLGFFGRGSMVKEFENVAFKLEKGEISAPVKTDYGYHIIKVTDRKEPKGKEFNKAKKSLSDTIKNQKFSKWFENYKKGVKIEIDDHEIQGYKLAGQKKLNRAMAEYSQAIDADPNNAYLYVNQGRIYMEKKQIKNALAKFQKAAEVNENDSAIRMILGNAYKENKDVDKAVEQYKKASELAPMDFYLHLGLLNTFQEMKRTEEAKAEETKLQAIAKAMDEQQKAQQEQQKQYEAAQKSAEEAAKKEAQKKTAGSKAKTAESKESAQTAK